MHSVQRSPEPDYFMDLRRSYSEWEELQSSDWQRIRDSLADDFGPVCAYCERPCGWAAGREDSTQRETIDHFRPRKHFSTLWLDWLNLVYCCDRCNQIKGSRWPQYDDELNRESAARFDGFIPVTEYVSPNAVPGRRAAGEFFGFDVDTGEMLASSHIDNEEWHIARRTIEDIDLNDSRLAENDPSHLWSRRLRQRDLLIQGLQSLGDFDSQLGLMLEFMLPDKPFSGFIGAYIRSRFPVLQQLFGP